MIYIINSMPKFCPECGDNYQAANRNNYNRSEFFNGVSQRCKCGTQFQYAPTEAVLVGANQINGDLERFAT